MKKQKKCLEGSQDLIQGNVCKLLDQKYADDLNATVESTDLSKEEIEAAINRRLKKQNSFVSSATDYCH